MAGFAGDFHVLVLCLIARVRDLQIQPSFAMPPQTPTFRRRLGPNACFKTEACPAILELDTGDFAVIGVDVTQESTGRLPPGTACGTEERIIRIPRNVLILAKRDIPDA